MQQQFSKPPPYVFAGAIDRVFEVLGVHATFPVQKLDEATCGHLDGRWLLERGRVAVPVGSVLEELSFGRATP